MDPKNWIKHPVRLAVSGFAALMIAIFGAHDAQLGSGTIGLDDLLFEFGIYALPFGVFVFMVWSGKWSEWKRLAAPLPKRELIGFAAEVMGVISPGLFLLTLPVWGLLAEHESVAGAWLLGGVLSSIIALVCTITGSPRRWLPALTSILMLPCWLFQAALLAKAAMD